MYYYNVELSVKKLLFGVSRNKEWWEKFPRRIKMLNKITQSIKEEGLKNPLLVSETEKGYVVEVGNQRLQALKNLGVDKFTCILSSKKIYEKLKKVSRNLYVAPNDIKEWDADIQFKGQ